MESVKAGAELVRQFDKYAPVKAAFWLKAADDPHRYLYIASNRVDGSNIDLAYGEVLRLASQIRPLELDPFRVKVVGTDHPLTKAASEVLARFPGTTATRFEDTTFGGVIVDEVYIYPSPVPTWFPGP